ncbi:hypothetical protein [Lysobacter sp. TAB13]|uniref:hypothetical protein n=1 Tax=Lysobacter sp. TAB13 TaxID=3233065 RepID=UPI003F9D863D
MARSAIGAGTPIPDNAVALLARRDGACAEATVPADVEAEEEGVESPSPDVCETTAVAVVPATASRTDAVKRFRFMDMNLDSGRVTQIRWTEEKGRFVFTF